MSGIIKLNVYFNGHRVFGMLFVEHTLGVKHDVSIVAWEA